MSITGQTGHIAFAKQVAFGTPNVTLANYRSVKVTGDSLVAANNMLVAEGEIGTGRDVTQAVPGGFSAAGAINGNLRARSASVLLGAALGNAAIIPVVTGPPALISYDEFTPADYLPVYTVEKQVGTAARSASELLTLRYTDVMVNTLNVSSPSAGLATFSAGLIACGESYIASPVVTTPSYATTPTSDDLLLFHGGRIRTKDSTDTDQVTFVTGDNDQSFQSMEVVINNNVQADEFTIRPSRFLRSLTEGMRTVECNMTIVFDDFAKYQKYTYGANARTVPGYNLYMGAMQFQLGNWQIIDAEDFNYTTATGAPASPQAVQFLIPKLAFSGFPVALSTGRIAVSTTARALKPGAGSPGNIIEAYVRPVGAGF